MLLMAGTAIAQGTFTVGDFALFASYLSWMAFVMNSTLHVMPVGPSLETSVWPV